MFPGLEEKCKVIHGGKGEGGGSWEEARIRWVDLLCFVSLPCLPCCTNPIEYQDLASCE